MTSSFFVPGYQDFKKMCLR